MNIKRLIAQTLMIAMYILCVLNGIAGYEKGDTGNWVACGAMGLWAIMFTIGLKATTPKTTSSPESPVERRDS